MKFWYEMNENTAGRKCFKVFHDRDTMREEIFLKMAVFR